MICEEEVHETCGGMTRGKAVGVDKLPVEAWKCMGIFWVQLYCADYSTIS